MIFHFFQLKSKVVINDELMTEYLTHNGLRIAVSFLQGNSPTVIFFPGFFSTMQGTKAQWLEACCKKRGQACIRFDYRGHGQSDGAFEDGTISGWLDDALLVLDRLARPPVVAVGSSMGGWIGLLAAMKRPELIRGFVGVAASPDFTRSIYEERISTNERNNLDQQGFILRPSEYRDEPVIITKKLIDDGKKHFLLNRKTLDLKLPVCLIHGQKDTDVSWKKSEKLHQMIRNKSELILVPDGQHRLSRPQDLKLIDEKVREVSSKIW